MLDSSTIQPGVKKNAEDLYWEKLLTDHFALRGKDRHEAGAAKEERSM